MIDPQITRRFESEAAFQEEKLRNLFRVVFRDEAEAWDRWKDMTERRGFSRARNGAQGSGVPIGLDVPR